MVLIFHGKAGVSLTGRSSIVYNGIQIFPSRALNYMYMCFFTDKLIIQENLREAMGETSSMDTVPVRETMFLPMEKHLYR